MIAARWLRTSRPVRPIRPARRLAVEPLEGRSVPALVTTTVDEVDPFDNSLSLREAIQGAAPGDTIDLTGLAGKIPLGSPLFVDKDLTIKGPPDRTTLTISGQDAVGVFNFNGAHRFNLSGMTIERARGAINLEYSADPNTSAGLQVTNCVFRNNTRFSGGAIRSFASNLVVSNSLFEMNRADFNGGAITGGAGGTLTVTDSEFTNYSAGSGGAISAGGKVTVTGTTFSRNSATAQGGGHFRHPVGLRIRSVGTDWEDRSDGGQQQLEE